LKKDTTKLLFGVHMHQPVDNFKEAVEEAVEKCYEPFFDVLKGYPSFKIALHCSGWLLGYIKKHHKKLFNTIKDLSSLGMIEFFSGGFYEPILPSIPETDRVAQIKKLSKTIKKEFSFLPKGAWLTERVWDDSLISTFNKCGIEYVMVDDYHLVVSGFDEDEMDGYYLSEFNAQKIALFPISKKLRYVLPFCEADRAVETIKETKCAIIFDDLEKFGLWPGTFEWVYEKRWLESFFEKVSKDNSIESVHFNDYLKTNRAKSLAYLQNVSYYEMSEWSLKAQNALELETIKDEVEKNFPSSVDKFVKGGTWKNFFIKYEESNRLHKRMLELSTVDIKSKKFLENLYKLQTNDVFWHGVFGGLYLPNLRDNAYSYLTNCEDIRYKDSEVIEINDTDMNGYDEIKAVKKRFVLRFDTHFGGQMVELLDREKKFNFQNVLTRRKEAYHKEILEEKPKKKVDENDDGISTIHNLQVKVDDSVKEALYYDWYVKNSFIDHISNDSFTLKNFKKCSFWEYGDFANQPFDYKIDKNSITFKREGGIYFDKKYSTDLTKRFDIKDDGFDFEIDLQSESENEYIYALECNLHFADLKNVYFKDSDISNEFELESLKEFYMFDKYTDKKINFSFDKPFKLFLTPLCTVSKSEKGFDLTVQGVSFAFAFSFSKKLQIQGKIRLENV